MLFNVKNSDLNIELKLGPITVPQVAETKLLGLYLDENLKWDVHIERIAKKISKVCGILYTVRSKLTEVSIRLVYHALIYSHIIYCIPIWGNAYRCHLRPVLLAQKRAVRTMTYSARYENTLPIFNRLKLLRIDFLHKYFSSLMIHKFVHHNYIQGVFTTQQNDYNLRNPNVIVQYGSNSSLYLKCVIYSAPSIWNNLNQGLRDIVNINSFKYRMKSYLLLEQHDLNR